MTPEERSALKTELLAEIKEDLAKQVQKDVTARVARARASIMDQLRRESQQAAHERRQIIQALQSTADITTALGMLEKCRNVHAKTAMRDPNWFALNRAINGLQESLSDSIGAAFMEHVDDLKKLEEPTPEQQKELEEIVEISRVLGWNSNES